MKKLGEEVDCKGFAKKEAFYTSSEIQEMINCIEKAEENDSFLKTENLFAIRRLLKNIPTLSPIIYTDNLKQLLNSYFSNQFFLTKAIYFDKPSSSNWFVPFHQDLSITVNQKQEVEGYTNWTKKRGQFGVQPPLKVLENTLTFRIHLDDTTAENGALRMIPRSHKNGIYSIVKKEWDSATEEFCEVQSGGIMLMKPLTLHASKRTTNGERRRVIHLEFNDLPLTSSLEWEEYQLF